MHVGPPELRTIHRQRALRTHPRRPLSRSAARQTFRRFHRRLANHPANLPLLLVRQRSRMVSRSLHQPPVAQRLLHRQRFHQRHRHARRRHPDHPRVFSQRPAPKTPPASRHRSRRRSANQAAETLALLRQLPQNPADKELRLTLGDLKAMAYLGNYYADKILGATDLALLRHHRRSRPTNIRRRTSASRHRSLETTMPQSQPLSTVHNSSPASATSISTR